MRQTRRQKLEFKFRTGQITPREMNEFTNKIPTRRSLLRDPATWLLAFLFVSVLLTLAGCAPSATYEKNRSDDSPGGILRAVTDIDTGCQYLVFVGPTGGITPRMDRNGKQVCK